MPQQHLGGQLLSARSGADITFQVGDETFAARAPVRSRRPDVAGVQGLALRPDEAEDRHPPGLRVNDMEAGVFNAMLHFIYTDSLPEVDDDDEVAAMAQHLLVAADRYSLDMLKLVCEEETLCNHVDTHTHYI
ncbi:hypothetical protein GUJ93_ZPchr0011g28783 [Zizania palustris]|uniref:BTB domain-containing protein n=1 Tax=Zizania palustris TaxID=103762 RepID=A0A8J5WEZ4_ZIZPA|nr:hypothetical protein GUJ93_ZPchr0011g28783 [Zizania palustris]